ncbi:MAG: FN3 domain-containing metallophosphoesterase family protein [Planctomycetia bacterium]|nr:FN3 domain-containing metallophosphoesterase family protein [Planctomycetia bacterium]
MSFLPSLFKRRTSANGNRTSLDRRAFLKSASTVGMTSAILATNVEADAYEIDELPPGVVPSNPRELLYPTPEPNSKIFDPSTGSYAWSYPILQNVAETSASVVWALNLPATGWVEYGETPNLGKVARNSQFGLNPYEEDFICARMTGLRPNTRYYYRTATCAFHYTTAYNKTISEPQYSEVYSFKTAGPNEENVSFAVLNDTHNQISTIKALFERFDELKPDMLVWNGDLCHRYPSSTILKTAVANPCDMPYAAERHLILAKGNHDRWGPWAHKFSQIFTPWIHEDLKFRPLGYNYALRRGPLAMIILDTAETAPDSAEKCQNISSAEPYRELQAAWLESVLKRPDIANAPYLLAFCHIPLFDVAPKENAKKPKGLKWIPYSEIISKTWGPIFDRSGIQMLITAHRHKFTYAEPTSERPWAQLTGGGPLLQENATCIHAEANSKELVVTCEKLADKSVLGTWTIKPRF